MTVLQYVLSLMEIENKNVIKSLINMVTEIKQTFQSLTTVSVVNNTHREAQNLYVGKIFLFYNFKHFRFLNLEIFYVKTCR